MQLFGDLTVEDLVAEEPEPIRLARALALSSSARSDLPQVDAERVSELAAAIAGQMRPRIGHGRTLPARRTVTRYWHCLRCPDRILALVGPPTARDRLEYEGHAAAGERLVRGVAGVSEVAEIVGAHEERFDGTGYPAGLSGAEIPLEGRIVALRDRRRAARAGARRRGGRARRSSGSPAARSTPRS